jgi:hypothetical protein
MSNVKDMRIVAEVPFSFLDNWDGEGLPDSEIALLARVLLVPSSGLTYEWQAAGYVPNDHGGRTAMYRITIEGQEALRWETMRAMAMALKHDPLAKLYVAEAADIEDGGVWAHVVDPSELDEIPVPGRKQLRRPARRPS